MTSYRHSHMRTGAAECLCQISVSNNRSGDALGVHRCWALSPRWPPAMMQRLEDQGDHQRALHYFQEALLAAGKSMKSQSWGNAA